MPPRQRAPKPIFSAQERQTLDQQIARVHQYHQAFKAFDVQQFNAGDGKKKLDLYIMYETRYQGYAATMNPLYYSLCRALNKIGAEDLDHREDALRDRIQHATGQARAAFGFANSLKAAIDAWLPTLTQEQRAHCAQQLRNTQAAAEGLRSLNKQR